MVLTPVVRMACHRPLLLLLISSLFYGAHTAPYTAQNAPWNINRNTDGRDPSKYFGLWQDTVTAQTNSSHLLTFQSDQNFHRRSLVSREFQSSHAYHPSPEDWRSEPIYQVITDRFNDGDPSNNEGSHFGFGGYDVRFVNMRHGGDFKGLAKRLPYIKSLGYSSIWISPIFQNLENQYHGYAQMDFTLLDDRFGTLKEFRDFVTQAHALGLYVIVDIVVNHMADLYYFEGYRGADKTPFKFHTDEYRLFPHDERRQYFDFHVDNHFSPLGRYGSVYDNWGQRVDDNGFYEGSFWNSDFHHNGDLRDEGYNDPWDNHLGKIYGMMDDLRTTHPRVIQKLIAMTKALLTSTDIDGIRIDTPMQVPLSFFQQWIPSIREHAASLGKRNFGVFGEFYCSRERASTMTGRGMTKTFDSHGNVVSRTRISGDATVMMDGGINYPMYHWFANSIRDQNGGLGDMMNLYLADSNDFDFFNPAANWTWQYRHLNFFNNHDQWRMAAATKMDGLQKSILSSSIIAFWPGVPLFYYGDEQGFKTPGSALDGWAREDFMTSMAWQKPECCSTTATGGSCNPANSDNFDQTHPNYLAVQKIMNVRNLYPTLQKCDLVHERWHQVDYTNGIFAFTRACSSDEKSFVLVMFNTWRETLTIDRLQLYTGWYSEEQVWNVMGDYVSTNGRYIPSERKRINRDGFIMESLSMGPYETKVFVREEIFKPLNIVVVSISPKHDEFIPKRAIENERLSIRLEFNQMVDFESVMQNLRLNGNPIKGFDLFGQVTAKISPDGLVVVVSIPTSLLNEGIHFIVLNSSTKSALVDSGSMFAPFQSRFRLGHAASNVIMNPCLNFKEMDMVVEQNTEVLPLSVPWKCELKKVAWGFSDYYVLKSTSIKFSLRHFAIGAEKLRVRFGYLPDEAVVKKDDEDYNAMKSAWSEWVSFANMTDHSLSLELRQPKCIENGQTMIVDVAENELPLLVQYWADGSSAYYVSARLSLPDNNFVHT